MKLDPRIYKDKKPLDCFDIQKAKKFLGVKGYFSPYIDYFSDLKLAHYGTLLDIDDKSDTPYGAYDDKYYAFFLPSAWVKSTEEQQQFADDVWKLSTLIHEFVDCYNTHTFEIMKRHYHEREEFLEDVFKRVLADPWKEY